MKALVRWARDHLTVIAIGLALMVVGGSLLYARHKAGQAREAELALDRQEARADTTRRVLSRYMAWLNGQAHTYQRRALQAEMQATDREEDIGIDPRARTRLTISLPNIDTTGLPSADSVRTENRVRIADLIYQKPPVRLEVTARVPPPPDTATWDVSMALEAIRAELAIGCGEAPEGRSIRPATANLTVPEWATVELTEVRTEPGVCNPVSGGWMFGWDPPAAVEMGLPLLGGIYLGTKIGG